MCITHKVLKYCCHILQESFLYDKDTYATTGISTTSPSTVTTILSLNSPSSVDLNSNIAATDNPGATGLSGFFTFSLNF